MHVWMLLTAVAAIDGRIVEVVDAGELGRRAGITAEIVPMFRDYSTLYYVATTRDCDQTTTVSCTIEQLL